MKVHQETDDEPEALDMQEPGKSVDDRAKEKRLEKALDDENHGREADVPPKTKKHLKELGADRLAETEITPEREEKPEKPEKRTGDSLGGFMTTPAKLKSGKEAKTSDKKKKKDSKKKKKSKKDKKRRKETTSSSSSSTSSSSSSSVFRVTHKGADKASQARALKWAEDHPGRTARRLLRTMHDTVGEEGESSRSKGPPPACAKQYDLRVFKRETGPQGINARNQREMSTLCWVLDHLAMGRYHQAADVVAGRIKSLETGNKEGHFHNAQFLELLPVHTEGLSSTDDKQVLRHEASASKGSWSSSGKDWTNYGKGKPSNYQWVPGDKSKQKGKGKSGVKGKAKGKGKKEGEAEIIG